MAEQNSNAHEARISRNQDDIKHLDDVRIPELWSSIDEIKKALAYRLPLWCTFLLMGLSSALTGLIVRTFIP